MKNNNNNKLYTTIIINNNNNKNNHNKFIQQNPIRIKNIYILKIQIKQLDNLLMDQIMFIK